MAGSGLLDVDRLWGSVSTVEASLVFPAHLGPEEREYGPWGARAVGPLPGHAAGPSQGADRVDHGTVLLLHSSTTIVASLAGLRLLAAALERFALTALGCRPIWASQRRYGRSSAPSGPIRTILVSTCSPRRALQSGRVSHLHPIHRRKSRFRRQDRKYSG